MTDNFDNLRLTARANLTIQTFDQIKATSPQLPSPSLVSQAMIPEVRSCKWREWIDAITHKATSGMCVHGQEKRDEEVVRIPEGFEGLLADLCVGRGIHQEHAEKHNMTRDTTSFFVVDVQRDFWPDLILFDIEEATSRLEPRFSEGFFERDILT